MQKKFKGHSPESQKSLGFDRCSGSADGLDHQMQQRLTRYEEQGALVGELHSHV